MRTYKHIIVESAFASAMAAAISVLWSPVDPWLAGVELHPSWLVVMAFAGFYGLRGLVLALPIAVALLGFAAISAGAGFAGAAARIAAHCDLLPLGGATIVGVISMLHHRRIGRLRTQLSELERVAGNDRESLEALCESLAELRGRADRIDLSVAFWRDIAVRIEAGRLDEAASAALELCMIRIGARAGIVRRAVGDSFENVVWRGIWSASQQVPSDIFQDRTLTRAVATRRLMLPNDVPAIDKDDSDVAVPIIAEDGAVLGVLGLRGVPAIRLTDAALRDLWVSAQWLAPALQSGGDTWPVARAALAAQPFALARRVPSWR